jgi:hypothetical protein
MAEPHWTPKMVAAYLEEAADTLRRLPNHRVGGYASAWPEIVRDYWEAFGWHDAEVDHALADQPAASWRAAIARVADRLLAARGCVGASPESGA